jgi:hypothetical protein
VLTNRRVEKVSTDWRAHGKLPLHNIFRDTAWACHARPYSSPRLRVCTSPRRPLNRLRVLHDKITRCRCCVRRYRPCDPDMCRYAPLDIDASYIFLSVRWCRNDNDGCSHFQHLSPLQFSLHNIKSKKRHRIFFFF